MSKAGSLSKACGAAVLAVSAAVCAAPALADGPCDLNGFVGRWRLAGSAAHGLEVTEQGVAYTERRKGSERRSSVTRSRPQTREMTGDALRRAYGGASETDAEVMGRLGGRTAYCTAVVSTGRLGNRAMVLLGGDEAIYIEETAGDIPTASGYMRVAQVGGGAPAAARPLEFQARQNGVGASLTMTPAAGGRYRTEINMSNERCSGMLEGDAVQQGSDTFVLSTGAGADSCRATIRIAGDTATVAYAGDCQSHGGLACPAFPNRLRRTR